MTERWTKGQEVPTCQDQPTASVDAWILACSTVSHPLPSPYSNPLYQITKQETGPRYNSRFFSDSSKRCIG